jgi:hypothetical protein
MAKIPDWLDNFIFNDLNGEYRQVSRTDTSADINLLNDENANRRYIGTYFPRSLMESFSIFMELYANEIIKNDFEKKKSIRIFDIGTGTGGNIIGLLFFLKKINFPSERVEIYTIEGNSIAINYQRNFVSKFNECYKTNYKLYATELVFTSAATFINQLNAYLSDKPKEFDIITSFKFFSEFYNANYNLSQGVFSNFVDYISKYLSVKGILLILDVLNPNTGRTFPFTTQIMSNELNAYVKKSNAILNYIIPVCCARWNAKCNRNHCYIERQFKVSHSRRVNDISKVCYRVIVRKEYSKEIISKLPENGKYKITHTNPQFCEHTNVYKLTENTNIADGFKLN